MTDIIVKDIKNGSEYYYGGSDEVAAEDVSYDNTTSGMTATDVQDAIDEVFQSVSNGKTLIAAAITDKGVPTAASDSFSTMATNIRAIQTGSGNPYTGKSVLRVWLEKPNRVTDSSRYNTGYVSCLTSFSEGDYIFFVIGGDVGNSSNDRYYFNFFAMNGSWNDWKTISSSTASSSQYSFRGVDAGYEVVNNQVIIYAKCRDTNDAYYQKKAIFDLTTGEWDSVADSSETYTPHGNDIVDFVKADPYSSPATTHTDVSIFLVYFMQDTPTPQGDNYIELSTVSACNLTVGTPCYYEIGGNGKSHYTDSVVSVPAGNQTVKIIPVNATPGWASSFKLVNGVSALTHDAPFSAYNVSTTTVADNYKKEFAKDCLSLVSVSADAFAIPNTVTSIGNNFMQDMLRNCNDLTTVGQISIPDSVTSIGNYFMANMFYSCERLTTPQVIDLGDGLQSIGDNFMYDQYGYCTSLTTTAAEDMPDSLSTIGNNFRYLQYEGCTALTSAQDEVMTSSLTSIGNSCRKSQFKGCTSLLQSADETVTATGTPSSSFTIGNDYKYGQYEGCTSLTETGSEAMPNVPTAIGASFKRLQYTGCTALATLSDEVLSNSTTSIGNHYRAEQYARTAPITNAADETITGTAAVGGTTIGDYYKYRQYYQNTNVTTAGTEALPSGTSSIGTYFRNYQYSGCTSLTSTAVENIGNNITTIGGYFRDHQYSGCTGLTSAQDEVLPNTLTNIGIYFRQLQYQSCSNLTTTGVESLPDNVTSIGNYFRNGQYRSCTALTNIKGWKDSSYGGSYYRYYQFEGCTTNKTVKVLSDVGYSAQSNTLNNSYVTEVQVPTAYLSNFTSTTTVYPRRSIDDSKFVGY